MSRAKGREARAVQGMEISPTACDCLSRSTLWYVSAFRAPVFFFFFQYSLDGAILEVVRSSSFFPPAVLFLEQPPYVESFTIGTRARDGWLADCGYETQIDQREGRDSGAPPHKYALRHGERSLLYWITVCITKPPPPLRAIYSSGSFVFVGCNIDLGTAKV